MSSRRHNGLRREQSSGFALATDDSGHVTDDSLKAAQWPTAPTKQPLPPVLSFQF
jgi:hypothetical protein